MATGPYLPGVYDKDGNPVPVSQGPAIKPVPPDAGPTFPSPQKAQTNVLAAIANLTPQAGLL